MLSPQEIERLAADLLRVYGEIESELLVSVAKRFSVLEGVPVSGMATWQTDKLQQLGALRQENIRIIAKHAKKTEAEITRMLEKAGYKALELDEAIYKKAYESGVLIGKAVPVYASPGVKQVITGAVGNMKQRFNLVNTTALQASQGAYIDIVNRAYLETSLGVRSYQDAIRTAVRDLADKGITGANYKSAKTGRVTRASVDVAVRRSVLTSTSQMAGGIQAQRAKEWGANLVEVTSHLDARPDHAAWQGQIYSLEGGTAEYPNLAQSTGYGTVTGLMGANCRHMFYPFFEGLSEQTYEPYDLEENQREYEESQEQRALERDIRQQKNRVLAADAIGDDETKLIAQIKLKEKEAKLNGFLDRTDRTRRGDRQQVQGFGRSQASQATWAVKKAKKT